MLQSNRNQSLEQVQRQINLIQSHIILLKQYKEQLRQMSNPLYIQNKIIVIDKQIAENENNLQQIYSIFNGTH